jgi:large subunit ribosomal protein L9
MAQVRLILKEEVYGLGEAGDLVSVKPGYARNFLLPQHKAEIATESRVKAFEHQKAVIAEKLAKEMKDVEAVKRKIEKLHLEFEAAAGDGGKLFGSITSAHIAEQLAGKGVEVDRRKIDLKEPIKSVGEHEVTVKVRREVHATIKLTVTAAAGAAAPEDEAEPEEERVVFGEPDEDVDETEEAEEEAAEEEDEEPNEG